MWVEISEIVASLWRNLGAFFVEIILESFSFYCLRLVAVSIVFFLLNSVDFRLRLRRIKISVLGDFPLKIHGEFDFLSVKFLEYSCQNKNRASVARSLWLISHEYSSNSPIFYVLLHLKKIQYYV